MFLYNFPKTFSEYFALVLHTDIKEMFIKLSQKRKMEIPIA